MANLLRYGFVRKQLSKQSSDHAENTRSPVRETVTDGQCATPSSSASGGDVSNNNEPSTKRKKSDDSLCSGSLTKDQKYDRLKRQRKFLEHWLEYDAETEAMFCKPCRDHPDVACKTSQLYKGTNHFKVDPLKTHEKTKEHISCMTRGPTRAREKTGPLEQVLANVTAKQHKSLTMLFNTAYGVLKSGRPFTDYEFVCSIQLKNNAELGENYLNRFACRRFLSSIAHVIRNRIKDDINSANFVSILGDGSTDAGILEQEIVYLRYVDPTECTPKTRQIDIVPLSTADSTGIFNALQTGLKTVDINFEDLKHQAESEKSTPKLVGVNFDGASVMMGQKSGVAKKITDIVPEAVVLHCVAHKLELAALDANKSAKYMVKFEDTIKGIFGFYHYSPKRRRELYEICAVLEEFGAHFSNVKQVRWLASKERAIKAIKQNLPAVAMHLQHSSDARAHGYYKEITSVMFLKHLYFMLDYLPLLATLSRAFQQENLLIMELPDHIECTTVALSALKTTPGKHMNMFCELYNPNTMKFGDVALSGRKPGPIDYTKDNDTLKIIDNTITYIGERFKNLKEEPLSLLQVMDFHKWPIYNEELGTFGNQEVHDLVHEKMKSCFTDADRECVNREWILLKMFIRPLRSNDLLDVYSGLLRMKNPALSHVLKLVELILAISPSTASCERGFSSMNNIKNHLRTQLTQESLSDQLHVVCEGPTLEDFNADTTIKHWLTSTSGSRHVHGHAKPQKNVENDQDAPDIIIDGIKK
ncbi:zinc finger protein 862-like [Ptychodera flava]|uniref:zinc finger protein 862-like n=1 Tax=Ptychodera flava TaxID=63121 RepID=UPI003969D592